MILFSNSEQGGSGFLEPPKMSFKTNDKCLMKNQGGNFFVYLYIPNGLTLGIYSIYYYLPILEFLTNLALSQSTKLRMVHIIMWLTRCQSSWSAHDIRKSKTNKWCQMSMTSLAPLLVSCAIRTIIPSRTDED